MKLSMVAVDLDGTLLGGRQDRYGIRDEVTESFHRLAVKGVAISLVTGRDMPFILGLLKREGIDPQRDGWPRYIIAMERAIYKWGPAATGTEAEEETAGGYIPLADWNKRVEAAERSQYTWLRAKIDEEINGRLGEIDPKVHHIDTALEEYKGFVELIFQNADYARRAESFLNRLLDDGAVPYRAVRNVAGIAIRHQMAGKGPALAELCRSENIAFHQVLAMGDSGNDLSMLDGRFGFLAAAPANAEIEVRQAVARAGGYLATGKCGEGVAEAVEFYLTRQIA